MHVQHEPAETPPQHVGVNHRRKSPTDQPADHRYGGDQTCHAPIDRRADEMTRKSCARLHCNHHQRRGHRVFPAELADLVQQATRTDVRELAELLADDKVTLIDVRNQGERELGAIPGSHHIPLAQLRIHLDDVPTGRPIVVHCAGGWRSSVAASLLRANGFHHVSDLAGGYNAWAHLT